MHIPPRIGITMLAGPDPVTSKPRYLLASSYIHAISKAGGIPIFLPPDDISLSIFEHSDIDALLLTGGGDIETKHFNQPTHPENTFIDPKRDEIEFALLKKAMARKMPILGICRGMQVINVALGGDLIQHLPDKFAGQNAHRIEPKFSNHHKLSLAGDSRLAAIMGATEIEIASWHHQAPEQIGQGLRVTGQAPDGVVEVLEMPSYSNFFIGILGHPEIPGTQSDNDKLFAAFVQAAQKKS